MLVCQSSSSASAPTPAPRSPRARSRRSTPESVPITCRRCFSILSNGPWSFSVAFPFSESVSLSGVRSPPTRVGPILVIDHSGAHAGCLLFCREIHQELTNPPSQVLRRMRDVRQVADAVHACEPLRLTPPPYIGLALLNATTCCFSAIPPSKPAVRASSGHGPRTLAYRKSRCPPAPLEPVQQPHVRCCSEFAASSRAASLPPSVVFVEAREQLGNYVKSYASRICSLVQHA